MGEKKGKIKEAVGWATGDREVEAEGRVEKKSDDPSEPVEEVTDEAIEDEQEAVKKDHHAVDDPSAPEVDEEEHN